jgi:protease I
VLDSGFEDSEFRVPSDRFRAAGHEVTVIGRQRGQTLQGYRGKERVNADVGIDEVSPDQFDALFIPGGQSPDHLRADPRFVNFARAFQRKPIFTICHGPQLLITAGMVRGRRMTAWQTVQVDLANAGANVVDQSVVVDGNLVTSRKPDDLDDFVRESLRLLGQSAQPSPAP